VTTLEVQVGSTITNGTRSMRVTHRTGAGDGGIGWVGIYVSLRPHDDLTGANCFVPDHLLPGWRHVPFEWSACPGGQEEERYVWGKGCRWLEREVRRTRVDCSADHGAGHPDCPRCWYRSPRNPDAVEVP
jgi:hypothetical protein